MLASLHIENIALIRRLDLDLAEGFCAFTGETGAGKSILIDAIGLLCGARGERDLVRTGEDSALVEGMFLLPAGRIRDALRELDAEPDEDGAIFLQRRLTADGRSAAKLNGRAVPLARLRDIAALLLNLHGQQDTQTLASAEKQQHLLDAFAGAEPLLADYRTVYTACSRLRRAKADLQKAAEELAEKRDLLLYQAQELKQAKPRVGEEEELLAEHALLANREKITEHAHLAYDALYANDRSAVAQTMTALNSLNRLAGILPECAELHARLEDAKAELTDIAESLLPYTADPEDASARLARLEARIDQLSALKRKYRTDEAGLLSKLKQVAKDLNTLENSATEQDELEQQLQATEQCLQEKAQQLHLAREQAAHALSTRVQQALVELDMPGVQFVIRLQETACGPTGKDDIEFAVSANAGEAPRPIGKIASGGELSRIMLCLQCVLADTEQIPTLIFDEIDTGISGKTNEKIGRMMRQIAGDGNTQVICVTHAAQLAARAANQYRIAKREQEGRTQTTVRLLTREERIDELARIMGGVQVTPAVRLAAEELLAAEDAGGRT